MISRFIGGVLIPGLGFGSAASDITKPCLTTAVRGEPILRPTMPPVDGTPAAAAARTDSARMAGDVLRARTHAGDAGAGQAAPGALEYLLRGLREGDWGGGLEWLQVTRKRTRKRRRERRPGKETRKGTESNKEPARPELRRPLTGSGQTTRPAARVIRRTPARPALPCPARPGPARPESRAKSRARSKDCQVKGRERPGAGGWPGGPALSYAPASVPSGAVRHLGPGAAIRVSSSVPIRVRSCAPPRCV